MKVGTLGLHFSVNRQNTLPYIPIPMFHRLLFFVGDIFCPNQSYKIKNVQLIGIFLPIK